MVTDWWWARVRLAESWDIMGAGSAAALGIGFGAPEFAMLSLAGDVIVCGTAGESSIGTVLVTGDGSSPSATEGDVSDSRIQSSNGRPLWTVAVAHSGLGDQVPGAGRILLEFAAQLGHVLAQVVGLVVVFRPPHVVQQLTLADELAGMA